MLRNAVGGRWLTDKREPILPVPGTRRIRPEPERSVPAAPGGELLVAVQRRAERADGVGADPGGLVAGQGFELFAHPQVVALVDAGHLVGHRNAYFAARPEDRRVGQAGVKTGRRRWSPST